MVISALAEDNKSKLAIFRKLNSCKANLNKYRKRPRLKSAAGTLIKNSNNKLIIHRRQLAKGRYNLSTHKPILASDSGTREIATDNSKLLQPITKPKGTHQPNNVIDNPTAVLPTVNTP